MAELRHSASMGNRSNAAASPVKRDSDDSKPLFSADHLHDGGSGKDDDDGDRRRSSARARDPKDLFFHHRHSSFLSSIRSFLDDPRGFSTSSRVFLAIAGFLIFLGMVFLPSLWSRLNAPYLCYKDGIALRCPRVKEAPSLWENPHASTTSWKPCAERRENGISGKLKP